MQLRNIFKGDYLKLQTKDKKYIEYLLKNYKRNKSRLRILELGWINEQDNILNAIDYSRDVVQTSNLSSLDNTIIAREEEIRKLNYEINVTEALLDSLGSRKDNQYRQLVENYYIENKTYTEVMGILGIYKPYHFFQLCKKVLNEFLSLI